MDMVILYKNMSRIKFVEGISYVTAICSNSEMIQINPWVREDQPPSTMSFFFFLLLN